MATLRIYTQYQENYAVDSATTPYWKNKGGYTFTINNVDCDDIMYCDNLKRVLSKICKERSNEYCNYEYLDHEVDFCGPDLSITSDMLNTAITSDFNEHKDSIELNSMSN
jgi:hypothetical protein